MVHLWTENQTDTLTNRQIYKDFYRSINRKIDRYSVHRRPGRLTDNSISRKRKMKIWVMNKQTDSYIEDMNTRSRLLILNLLHYFIQFSG